MGQHAARLGDSRMADTALRDREIDAQDARLSRLNKVLQVTRLLVSEMSLDDLLRLIIHETAEVMDAERCTVYVVDRDRGELWSRMAILSEIQEIRMPVGFGLAGYVAQTGETVNIADCYADSRFNGEVDKATGWRTRNMLVMPMRDHRGDITGVFQVMNKRHAQFTHEDEELLVSLAASAAIAVENAELYGELKRLFDSFVATMSATLDARDRETAGHSERVTAYAVLIAQEMGLAPPEVEKIRLAGLLHDIGKIHVTDAILTKAGKLTEEEFRIMDEHALYTRSILANIRFPRDARDIPDIASQHHERPDGRGKPLGLAGDAITLGGRILAVADVFDALSERRYYKEPMPLEQVLDILRQGRGTQFDADVVDALLRCVPRILEQHKSPAGKPT